MTTEYYDDIYFSDSEGWETESEMDTEDKEIRKREIKKKQTDEELLYDPSIDEKNEIWVTSRNVANAPRDEMGQKSKVRPTDAVLTCPLCWTPLCYDCQKHDKFLNQYRAMFVENCKIISGEVLKFAPQGKKAKRTNPGGGEDVFHPVECNECGTRVAVIDSEEIYHFFNVIPS
ncbi:hypothetical protein K493DRAFT_333018 [Basidiobolus meristosporus CBS 931.73]|uniref:E2F-associated phosphoprotein n=1 Tax=Basidiobolus meristosporus CBS 931.73 TaxID=1314790 RepID=A0A1Y1ZA84_9FUNG|nr:hypothetical protein K493DRAFT_333018 [Basidiobolus meristosporus CBS 931.73]|eukprot:ORY06705.1 hypothetical protein K493DRAFT_333018 [Basidiobolus meristosporus CBS 931.73]